MRRQECLRGIYVSFQPLPRYKVQQILCAQDNMKNAILDGCSTVDSKLDYEGIGWDSVVLHGTRWYFAIE